jgi:hypothetical protein
LIPFQKEDQVLVNELIHLYHQDIALLNHYVLEHFLDVFVRFLTLLISQDILLNNKKKIFFFDLFFDFISYNFDRNLQLIFEVFEHIIESKHYDLVNPMKLKQELTKKRFK